MDNNFTPADYAAMNGGFGGGNQEWLWIILFFLFAGGGNGFTGITYHHKHLGNCVRCRGLCL